MGADMEVADPSALAEIDYNDGTLGRRALKHFSYGLR
jgi:hypothetical protein